MSLWFHLHEFFSFFRLASYTVGSLDCVRMTSVGLASCIDVGLSGKCLVKYNSCCTWTPIEDDLNAEDTYLPSTSSKKYLEAGSYTSCISHNCIYPDKYKKPQSCPLVPTEL